MQLQHKNIYINLEILPILLIYGTILYYIYYLEKEKCKCVKTWHHNYIKYTTILLLIIMAYELLGGTSNIFVVAPLIILTIINIYAVYAYINALSDTQCTCAVHDMKYLHNTIYYVVNVPNLIINFIIMLFRIMLMLVKFIVLSISFIITICVLIFAITYLIDKNISKQLIDILTDAFRKL